MNVANVIPLSAPHSVPYAKSGDSAVLNPVRVRFDRFELDEVNARLLRDGTAVALAPTPFAVLCALVRQPGSLLTTNALLDDVWGHRFVTDSVLRTAISELRTALDDDARKPRFIETVSRRGYRFIASTIGASSHRPPAVERNLAAGRDHPALGVLTALCRGGNAFAVNFSGSSATALAFVPSAFDFDQLAPAGVLNHKVTVYVAPDPLYIP